MAVKLLIKTDTVRSYKFFTDNVSSNRIEPYVLEVQQFELKEKLGYALYNDLIKKFPDAGIYDKLINGEEYTDPQGYTIQFDGLKGFIAYAAFARFIENQQLTITSNSIVRKTNQYSEPSSDKAIAARVMQAKSGALSYWNDAEKYLNDKCSTSPATYPLWKKSGACVERQAGGIRISTANVDRHNQYSICNTCGYERCQCIR